jgi:hypothetical protein
VIVVRTGGDPGLRAGIDQILRRDLLGVAVDVVGDFGALLVLGTADGVGGTRPVTRDDLSYSYVVVASGRPAIFAVSVTRRPIASYV